MTFQLRQDVSLADTEYGTVLLDERSGRYWQLNPSGVLVVNTLLAGDDTEQAVTALTEEYQVDAAKARADVRTLVDGLRSAGLVSS
ncbi:lasso peptide biosynthesis PqqD family chaperone [Amycolatopsis cihanbeyliensis]|uniref:Coenzyme PQQ synthesis protein D (PqqD) n=1 Tax=Amycolatopsis cihanbeyliensis TaxID=1128664 RepID=A0A542DQJ4_AMYCI|nr:lasso peptide biosynthesis PqqD family chaperone [Amycolatopsis cihanbeyliensis]TQJ05368.1 coenzyme PQQ synthesis protein D (PqqD) [Amycolatopsis cihanbeyliensis]